jgi:hypothetical protein
MSLDGSLVNSVEESRLFQAIAEVADKKLTPAFDHLSELMKQRRQDDAAAWLSLHLVPAMLEVQGKIDQFIYLEASSSNTLKERSRDRLVLDRAFVPYFYAQGVKEDNRIHRFQGPLLPFAHFID